jgi:hypothetical protein
VRTHAKRLGATAMLAIVVTLMFSASAATAVTGGSLSKNLNIANAELIRVFWSGVPAGTDVVISQCNGKALDPSFDLALDCGQGQIKSSAYTVSGSGQTGTTCPGGTASTIPCNTGLNRDYRIFVDFDFTELGWECGAPGTPVAEAGDVKYSTCYIRVTEGQHTNLDADFFLPMTWEDQVEPEPVVPEAPYAVLLPAGAVAVAAAAYFVLRNRRPTIAA